MSEMADWDNEYSAHPVWEDLQNVLNRFNGLEPNDDDEARQVSLAVLRLTAILERRHTASLFVTSTMLTTLRDTLEHEVAQPLYRDSQSPNSGYRSRAIAGIDSIMEVVRGWPPSKDTFGRGVLASLKESDRIGAQRLEDLLERVNEVQSALSKRQQEFLERFDERESETRETLDQIRSDSENELQSLRTDIETTRLLVENLGQTANRQSTRMDTALNQIGERFNTAEQKRLETFDNTLQGARREQSRALNELKRDLKEHIENQKLQGTQLLTDFESSRDKLNRLLEAAGGDSTSAEYSGHSTKLKTQADRMFWSSIFLFILAAAAIGFLFWYQDGLTTDATRTLLVKATLASPLVIAGWALLRQSRDIRTEASFAKEKQLRLAAFEPLIANMNDDTKKQELRESVVKALIVEGKGGLQDLDAIDRKHNRS